MQRRVVFATGNQGKIKEIKAILDDLNMEVISMEEAGFQGNIEETGKTFQENAIIKAQAVWNHCQGIVLADDSGLIVDFLNGEPGVYSSRYLGEDTPYEIKNQMIIERLAEAKDKERNARFISVIAAVMPDGRVICTEGTVEGIIASQAAGVGGFGYDPIFYLPEFKKTAAQLTLEEKNKISHRGKALRKMKEQLKQVCKGEA